MDDFTAYETLIYLDVFLVKQSFERILKCVSFDLYYVTFVVNFLKMIIITINTSRVTLIGTGLLFNEGLGSSPPIQCGLHYGTFILT